MCFDIIFFPQNGDDPASDSNGGDHMTLPPVECREKHGYVLVDLQHIVRSTFVQCTLAMLWLCIELRAS